MDPDDLQRRIQESMREFIGMPADRVTPDVIKRVTEALTRDLKDPPPGPEIDVRVDPDDSNRILISVPVNFLSRKLGG